MTDLGRPTPIVGNQLLMDTVERILTQHCRPEVAHALEDTGRADRRLWALLQEAGITSIGSVDGCADGGVIDAVTVLRACGRHAAPVPAAEHGLLAGWLAARGGAHLADGMWTVPILDDADQIGVSEGRCNGRFAQVPYAASATHLIAAISHGGAEHLVVRPNDELAITPSRNIAGEPRDLVTIDGPLDAELPLGTIDALKRRGTLGRVALMTGSMRRVVEISAAYSHDRQQFGRPIAAFQAVQHLLALATEHLVNAEAACWAAAHALATDAGDPDHRVDVARVITHESMEVVTRNCHQVLGAMGTTSEHELHLHTRRLWAWDLEWGAAEASAAALSHWVRSTAPAARWTALRTTGASEAVDNRNHSNEGT